MRRAGIAAFCAVLFALPALAEGPLGIDAFERLMTGRTYLHFDTGTEPYGAEEYLPGRRVRWAFAGDVCLEGRYYDEDGYICFVYDDGTGPQCWHYETTATGLVARFRDDGGDGFVYRLEESPEPLVCAGPDVGV